MMAIAAVVPHYLLGLAAGAAILGCFMPIAGYIIPVANIPKPFWRYPMHYLGYHTYSMNGMMANEFLGTDGWGCPCELQPEGCATAGCTTTGEEVRVPAPSVAVVGACCYKAMLAGWNCPGRGLPTSGTYNLPWSE